LTLLLLQEGVVFTKRLMLVSKIKQLLFHLYYTIFSTNSTVFFFSCGGQIIKCPSNADWCSYQQGVDILEFEKTDRKDIFVFFSLAKTIEF
jgi:hypothetical protein